MSAALRTLYPDFYEMVHTKPKIKLRNCMRCRKKFRSTGNHFCAGCTAYNARARPRDNQVYWVD